MNDKKLSIVPKNTSLSRHFFIASCIGMIGIFITRKLAILGFLTEPVEALSIMLSCLVWILGYFIGLSVFLKGRLINSQLWMVITSCAFILMFALTFHIAWFILVAITVQVGSVSLASRYDTILRYHQNEHTLFIESDASLQSVSSERTRTE